ncbi:MULTISPECIES: SAF domain-containing protein [unclassified Mycolicibacterium]|uniref:SAF domain-containing protein n=1 Tax=unclassified Mycolicibacterium TaxID=2636767 RepID=UPI0012DF00BA|nr:MULTISPECIES: SAF domain-containing protein [unclassified Mycolicibacterium]MUL85336.1 flagellar biosynthesis protein FlgA [Mycolicibacterium sp. CBMA 329]MUL91303.1 flagellar biosynthesis protein FlgA [Mycolicibacterium sp. CBMA 331]MUM02497.1 flagellar biosynthesis protein FlgA [Mycolicibacterium sp. CBMA 334]MUM30180.1 flagellar biosynthesis protein FlgA [Mycolicibacterium sp. CBMA 295]MUM41062.1 flagellar biosynthesis protein FlgA [Mycolicibacterium sp. CBMA 247]
MAESLNPSSWRRLTAARPDWTRTVAARRVAAAGLVVLAAIAALRSDPRGDYTDIAVAAHDLSPGIALTATDVRLERRSTSALPDGAQRDVAAVLGATLTAPARRGEVITDVRLLGSRLAESTAGPDARIVPLKLSDTALLDLIRPGDVVDVLTVAADRDDKQPARPLVVASGAVVVLVSEKAHGAGTGTDRVALVALPARSANEVAATSLVQDVTLTIH